MKRNLLLLFILSFISYQGFSQLVITEIMYNSPDGGQDTLEYFELYNNSNQPLDINGYEITDGVTHTFENTPDIPAHGYLVVSGDANAVSGILGITAVEWTSGGLKNSGETIEISNNGSVVASVTYGDDGDWPTEADGDGYSLELCDVDGDTNDPFNWGISRNATGIFIDGVELYTTPGSENDVECQASFDYEVLASSNIFTPADLTIEVGETVLFRNTDGFHNVNGSQSEFPDNPESFFSGAPSSDHWEYVFTFNIDGVYNYQCDPHAGQGMTGTITVVSNVVVEEISAINPVDPNTGVVIRDGEEVTTKGIVHSPNFNSSGYSFTIQDAEDKAGINIYAPDDFGYEVKLGDELEVTGTVGQYNGLTQIVVTKIVQLSEDNDLHDPEVVTNFDDDLESHLVKIESVSLVDENEWRGTGSYNVSVTDGTNTYTLRIDGDTELTGQGAPTGAFDVTGVLGQYDPEEPYLEGYQLFPRFISDIDPFVTAQPDYPEYDIATVTTVDSDGVLDSLNVNATLEGIMVGHNFSANGYQIVIINDDNTAGITIYSSEIINDVIPVEGDLVQVKGKISQFNGLAQIAAIDLEVLSSGNDIPDADEVNSLGEDTENRYIEITGNLVETAAWAGDGNNANYDIDVDGTVYTIRIDAQVPIANYMYDPSTSGTKVTVTGVGGQYDRDDPRTDGYQILPFEDTDVEGVVSVIEGKIKPSDLEIFPNPFDERIIIKSTVQIQKVRMINSLGQLILEKDINNHSLELNTDDFLSGNYIIMITTDEGILTSKLSK